ncbi:MAG: hypothetical protein FJY99_03115 [Candidatus Sericytochromatia bacterium]|nr:hypothetical protein [Candidatus Tanganyikabacteria bacterium]
MAASSPLIRTRPIASKGLKTRLRHRVAARGGSRHVARGVLRLEYPEPQTRTI